MGPTHYSGPSVAWVWCRKMAKLYLGLEDSACRDEGWRRVVAMDQDKSSLNSWSHVAVAAGRPWMCLGVRVYSLSLFVTCANLASNPFALGPTQMLDGNSFGEEANVQHRPMVSTMDGEAHAKTQPQDVTSFSSGSTWSLRDEILHPTRPSSDFLVTCYPGLVEDQLCVQEEK